MPIVGRQLLKGAGVPVRKRVVINNEVRVVDRDTLIASEQRIADSVLEGFSLVPDTAYMALVYNPGDTTYEQAVAQALSLVETDIAAELHAQVVAGGVVAAKELSTQLVEQFTALAMRKADRPSPIDIAARFTFNPQHPEAVAWARNNAARLVTNMTRDQKDAIRGLIADASGANSLQRRTSAIYDLLGQTRPGTQRVRAIAESIGANMNGLTKRYEQAVFNNAQRIASDLAAQGITGTKALDIVRNKSDKYATKLRRARSRTIARTETIRALNEGRQQAWQQAAEQGLINKQTARKTWVTGPMDVCPICQPLNGTSVPLDGQWKAGMTMVRTPPAHPNCRCSMTLQTLPTQQPRGIGTGQPGDPLRIDYGAKPKLDDYPPLPGSSTSERLGSPLNAPSAPRGTLPDLPTGSRLVSPGGEVPDFHVTPDGRVRVATAQLERDAQAVWRRFDADGLLEEFIPSRNSAAGRVERFIRQNPELIKPQPVPPIIEPPVTPNVYRELTEADVRRMVDRQRTAGLTVESLPQYEKSIVSYTDGSGTYGDVNLSLRDSTHWATRSTQQQERIGVVIDDLDSAIRSAPATDQPMLVYRGIRQDYVDEVYGELKVGQRVTEPAFSSTSASRDIAQVFARQDGYILEIEAPAGTRGFNPLAYRTGDEAVLFRNGYNESEFLLQRGTTFEVVERNGNVIRLRIVDQPPPSKFFTGVVEPGGGKRLIVPPDGKIPGHVIEADGRVLLQDKDQYRDQAGVWYRKVKGGDTYEPFVPSRNSAAGTLEQHLKRQGVAVKPVVKPPTAVAPTPKPAPLQGELTVDISDLQPRIDRLHDVGESMSLARSKGSVLQRSATQYGDWTATPAQEDALEAVMEAGRRVEERAVAEIEKRSRPMLVAHDEALAEQRRLNAIVLDLESQAGNSERQFFLEQADRAFGKGHGLDLVKSVHSDSWWADGDLRRRAVRLAEEKGPTPEVLELLDNLGVIRRDRNGVMYSWEKHLEYFEADRVRTSRSFSWTDGAVEFGSSKDGFLYMKEKPNAWGNTPAGKAVRERIRTATDEMRSANDVVTELRQRMAKIEKQVIREVLEQSRPSFGRAPSGRRLRDVFKSIGASRTAKAPIKDVEEAVERLAEFFPGEWVDDWIDYTAKTGAPWKVNFKKRGHYSEWDKEISLSGVDWRSTLIHELQHGLDKHRDGLSTAHALFYRRRMRQLGVTDGRRTRIYKGKDEWAYELLLSTGDGTDNLYRSKTYDRTGSWELMTMGMEDLWKKRDFFKDGRLEAEYRHYILGLLIGL